MDILINILLGIVEQGLIYAILAMGVYITYKVLNFPDLSVDGTFAFGAAVTVSLISAGVNPWVTLVISFLAGGCCGVLVAIMHIKFKITDLLCGIIMMTGLYSVNVRVAGSSLVSIAGKDNIFNGAIGELLSNITKSKALIISLIIVIIVKILLDLYLKTKSGMLLKAVGDNKKLIESLGENPNVYKTIGLGLGNGLAALSGGLLCQQQKYFEINMGVGMMVMAIASLIIGISVFKRFKIMTNTTKVIIGAIIYKGCVSFALNFGLEAIGLYADDLKLVMALVFLIILVINNGAFSIKIPSLRDGLEKKLNDGREKDATIN